jgi:hypothetical protein
MRWFKRSSYNTLVCSLFLLIGCGRSGVLELLKGLKLSTQIVDDSNKGVGYYPDLQIDRNLVPLIAYYDRVNGDLKLARLNRSTGFWEKEVLDENGDVGLYPNLGFDEKGDPWIFYLDNSRGVIKLIRKKGNEWGNPLVIEVPNYAIYGFIRARRSPDGLIYAVAVGLNRIRGTYDVLYLAVDLASGKFSGGPIASNVRTPGLMSEIPQSTDLVFLPREGKEPSLAIFFYHQIEEALYLALSPDPPYTSWDLRRLAGTPELGDPDIGQYVSAINEGGDQVHLAYQVSDHRQLKYLAYSRYTFSTGELLTEVVDMEGFVGEYASIVLDRSGKPAISYYDSTNNDLKLAVRAGENRWFIFRPDLVGIVGDNARMILLPDGQFGIAYRDETRGALKFTLVLAE